MLKFDVTSDFTACVCHEQDPNRKCTVGTHVRRLSHKTQSHVRDPFEALCKGNAGLTSVLNICATRLYDAADGSGSPRA